MLRNCPFCNKVFETKTKKLYCDECINETKTCPVCAKSMMKYSSKTGMSEAKTCSRSCAAKLQHRSETYTNPFSTKEFKENREKNIVEKYGSVKEFYNNRDAKTKECNLDKYGTEWYMSTKDFKEKSKKTNIKKYGVENAGGSAAVQCKILETMNNTYGSHYFSTDDAKNKIRKHWSSVYGVDYFLQASDVREKIKDTCRRKYGGPAPASSEKVRLKMVNTLVNKTGYDNYLKNPTNKEKFDERIKQKYGVDNISQLEEVKEKKIITNNTNFGVDYPTQRHLSKESIKIITDKNLLESYILLLQKEYAKVTYALISNKLGYSYPSVRSAIKKFGLTDLVAVYFTQAELEIQLFLQNNGYNTVLHDRQHLYQDNGYSLEIDVFVPDINVGIEFDGTYWHSDDFLLEARGLTYKEDCKIKDDLAEKNGLRIIHIREEDWVFDKNIQLNNILAELIKSKRN